MLNNDENRLGNLNFKQLGVCSNLISKVDPKKSLFLILHSAIAADAIMWSVVDAALLGMALLQRK